MNGNGSGARILVVEDDEVFRRTCEGWLAEGGHEVGSAREAIEAYGRVRDWKPDLVLLDLMLPPSFSPGEGMAFMQGMRRLDDPPKIVVVTAAEGIQTAALALRSGAVDVLAKPAARDLLSTVVDRALTRLAIERATRARLHVGGEDWEPPAGMIGRSAALLGLAAVIRKAARSSANVLILGESGSGKELAARAVHDLSPRREGPFVVAHCAALSEGVQESELFGHEKGAFTDARTRRTGLFEAAHGGTMLLDEVGDIPPSTQVKLLRAIQHKEISRVGGTQPIRVDVRIVSATHRDLEAAIREGRFREDLYWRLAALPIHVPALRERREDIPLLVRHFLDLFCREEGRLLPPIDTNVMERLASYAWPGNVRELDHEVRRLVVNADEGEPVLVADLAARIRGEEEALAIASGRDGSLRDAVRRVELWAIRRALARHAGNRTRAAVELGLSRRGLQKKLASLGMR